MKQLNLILLFIIFATGSLLAQTRYYDEIFTSVQVEEDVPYGRNISVLRAPTLDTIDLVMDVYTPPEDDCVINRPVFIYVHTGTFLPQYFNQQITGGKKDSTVVEICSRLAKRGYVAVAITYRQGWNATATDQDERTSTLLLAAYRGVIDAKTCARYLRKTAKEENPYGIDSTKIAIWGQGTGGYVACGAYLDDIDEVQIPKFIDGRDNEFYVQPLRDGDVNGEQAAVLNVPNHVGYSSDFQMVVNMGGAMGDVVWVDGEPEREPPYIGFHPLRDPFAPYINGAVINPVTNQFVIDVSGSRVVAAKANETGINAVFAMAEDNNNSMLSQMSKDMNDNIAKWGQLQFNDTTTLAENSVYPFITPTPQSGPWEWWGFAQLEATIAGVNALFGTEFSAATLDFSGKLTNPDVSKEKAMRYIDSLMAYVGPRAFYTLAPDMDIEKTPCMTGVNILSTETVQLQAWPNPADDYIVFKTDEAYPIRDIAIYNVQGRLLKVVMGVNNHQYEFQRKDLAPGMYVAKLRFDEGITSRKIIFRE